MKYKRIPSYQYDWEAKLLFYAESLGFTEIEPALYYQYVIKKLSYKKISEQAHINAKTIRRFLVLMDVEIGHGGQPRVKIDPKELAIYLETHIRKEAAKHFNCCINTIWKLTKKDIVPCRICGGAREPENYRSGNCDACRSELGGEDDYRCIV